MYRNDRSQKPLPQSKDIIIKSLDRSVASLSKINWSSAINKGNAGGGGVNKTGPVTVTNDYVVEQQEETFNLWITQTMSGFGIKGPSFSSHYYKKFYPQSFEQMPIAVSGVCVDEVEYNYLAAFVREQQVAMTVDYNNLFRLEIPAANVDALGFISKFTGGVSVENTGVPLAPVYTFDFQVFKNLNDSNDTGNTNSNLNAELSYLITYNPSNKKYTTQNDFNLDVEATLKGIGSNPVIYDIIPTKAPTRRRPRKTTGAVRRGPTGSRGGRRG
jgi:hypothetical protein